jgi:4-amino-4-deoxy-L-arabinose transferase-like glycosyltransferase
MKLEKFFNILAILLIIFSLCFKIYTLNNSIVGFDEAGTAYIANEMSSGKMLYLDYFDHKSPFMHYALSLAFKLIEPTQLSIKLIALFFDIFLLICIYLVARLLVLRYALLSAAIYSVLNLNLSLNAEVIVAAFGLLATLFYTKSITGKNTQLNLFIAGLLIAVAIWFKQPAAVFYLAIIAHLVYLKYQNQITKSELIRNIAIFTAGVLALSIPLLVYFLYKVGFYFLYAILKFNTEFTGSSSRIIQMGKGLNILLFNFGFMIAVILASITSIMQKKEKISSLFLIICLFTIGFIFFGQEIFYQHFFQLAPFIIILTAYSLTYLDEKARTLAIIILLIGALSISLVALEDKAREIKSGQIEKYDEVFMYLENEVPKNASFFADNPIYTFVGQYKLNQPLVGCAPSFNSVFNYSFICNLSYLVLTHRQNYLSEDEKSCIKDNYVLLKRFDNVGESFVEIWKLKNSTND